MDPNSLSSLGNQVASSTQQEYDLPNMLRNALVSKFSKDNPLLQQRETALKNLYASPEQSQQEFSQPHTVTIGGGQVPAPGQNPVGDQSTVSNVYFDPSQQRALSSQRLAARAAPLMNLNDIIAANYGGIDNIISGVTRGLEAQTKSKQAKFDAAKVLQELALKSRALDISQYKASKGGSGSNLNQLLSVYRLMKPSDSAQNNAINAQSGLTAIEQTRAALQNDKNVLKKSGIPLLGSLFNMIDPNVQQFNSAKRELTDVLTRLRTGAALNAQELQEYNKILQTFDKPKTIETNLTRLENLYNKINAKAQIPNLLDFLSTGLQENNNIDNTSDWEIVQ